MATSPLLKCIYVSKILPFNLTNYNERDDYRLIL